MKEVKISVVMATFNGEKYLKQQLESIEAQTVKPHELLVFDDGSSDGTLNVLTEFSKNKPWITIVANKVNVGVNQNFLNALNAATGDVVFVSDQDDVWVENKIELFLNAWREELLLFSDGVVVDSVLSVINESEFDFHGCPVVKFSDPWYFLHANCVSGHSMMVSKKLVDILPSVPNGVFYDQWCALVASAYGEIGYVSEKTCYHRMHASNVVNNPEVRKGNRVKREKLTKTKRQLQKRKKLITYYKSVLMLDLCDEELKDILRQLVLHYSGGHQYFDFKLFKLMYRNRDKFYTENANYWQKVRAIRNHCFGERLLWMMI